MATFYIMMVSVRPKNWLWSSDSWHISTVLLALMHVGVGMGVCVSIMFRFVEPPT